MKIKAWDHQCAACDSATGDFFAREGRAVCVDCVEPHEGASDMKPDLEGGRRA